MNNSELKAGFFALLFICILTTASAQTAAQQRIVARVGATPISAADFAQAYEQAQRSTFYHGKPAPDQQKSFQRKVSQNLIEHTLLLQEAKRRGLQVESKKIDAALDNYDKRYAKNPTWQNNRDSLLANLRVRLEQTNLVEQLEDTVRQTPMPTAKEIQRYYNTNKEKFTEPAQRRVSLILLKVDPSSSREVWNDAARAADQLTRQLRQGADFAILAQEYSGDPSAAQGGDMGYLHQGMLGEQVEQALRDLQVGAISEPIKVLEGIAIFQLTAYQPPQQRPLQDVQQRTIELWQQERGDQAWQNLLQKLRANTPIEVYDRTLVLLEPA